MLERFKKMLKKHDWYYSFSDDTHVWKTEREKEINMVQLGKDIVANGLASSSEVARLYNEAKPESLVSTASVFFETGGKIGWSGLVVDTPVFVEEESEEAKAAHKVVYVKQKLDIYDHMQAALAEFESSLEKHKKNNKEFQAALETARDGLLGVRGFY